jgi:hypothetical protein
MAQAHWKDKPEKHDFPAALDYLILMLDADDAAKLVTALQGAKVTHHKCKDILRASELPILPVDNKHVARDLAKVAQGELLSPVLLIRGRPLIIADGYHRVCASYWLDEDADIPCLIVDGRR